MRIGIYSNLKKDIGGSATKSLIAFLKDKKEISLYLCDDLKTLNIDGVYLNKEDLAAQCELIVVFGGDGTVLRIAKPCAAHGTRVLAVNLGNMGFLTEVEKDIEISSVFSDVLAGKYFIDKRNMLEITYKNKKYAALNEIVLERGTKTKMLKCEVSVDHVPIDRYSADGIIVCTPTGSTAYSLSAGGPIVAPDVSAMIITPICPHSLHSRPLVINNKQTVRIKLLTAVDAHVNVDGDDVVNVFEGETVTVKKSKLTVEFLRLKKYNYYEKLMDKMHS